MIFRSRKRRYTSKSKQDKQADKKRKRDSESEMESPTKKQKTGESSFVTLKDMGYEWFEKEANVTYKASPKDKPELVSVKEIDVLKNDSNDKKNLGICAAQTILPGTTLGTYTGEIISGKVKTVLEYGIKLSNGKICNAQKVGNFLSRLNSSMFNSNTKFDERDDENGEPIVDVVATKKILVGQQCLVSYNVPNQFYELHPDDNEKSAAEWLEQYKGRYQSYEMKQDFKSLNLVKGDVIFVTAFGISILNKSKLTKKNVVNDDINLRFYKQNKKTKKPVDFNAYDTFSVLMLACYMGQFNNIKILLELGADKNRQQVMSKRSPLFFAVLGVQDQIHDANSCMKVLELLLSQEVNIEIQDNEDKTFMYYVLNHFDADQVETVLSLIKKNYTKGQFNNLYSQLDKNDDDIFLFAIKNKMIAKAEMILKFYPDYMRKHVCSIKDPDPENKYYYDSESIKEYLGAYNASELKLLKKILKDYGTSEEILKEIFPAQQYGRFYSVQKEEDRQEAVGKLRYQKR